MEEEIKLELEKECKTQDAFFYHMEDIEIQTFKNMLKENSITYTPMYTPYDTINDIIYEAKSLIYSSFKEFVGELNSKAIEEIYLYSVERHFKREIGESVYIIRFAKNEDLINIKCLKLISQTLDDIFTKVKAKGVTSERLNKLLNEDLDFPADTSKYMIKLIRIIDKLEF